jgi:hypothetical protein
MSADLGVKNSINEASKSALETGPLAPPSSNDFHRQNSQNSEPGRSGSEPTIGTEMTKMDSQMGELEMMKTESRTAIRDFAIFHPDKEGRNKNTLGSKVMSRFRRGKGKEGKGIQEEGGEEKLRA